MRNIGGLGVLLTLVTLVLIGGILEGGRAFASPGADGTPTPTAPVRETYDVSLTGTVNGTASTFEGSMTVDRYDETYCDIVSLDLAGMVGPNEWTVGLLDGYCDIGEVGSYGITAYVAVTIDTGGPASELVSCPGLEGGYDYFVFNGVSETIPPEGTVDFAPVWDGSLCDAQTGDPSGYMVELSGASTTPAPVGGRVELGVTSGGPDASLESSSGSGFNYLALAAGLAAAAVAAVVAGGWYARRRWQR